MRSLPFPSLQQEGSRRRIPHVYYRLPLKTTQEVVTLVVFCVFSVLYLREPLKWNYLVGFGMMVGAVFLIFKEW